MFKSLRFALALCSLSLGIYLFTRGFFPFKRQLACCAGDVDSPSADTALVQEPLRPQYDRLVFMVVDALRHDFLSRHMPYLKKQIQRGHALDYIGLADLPTVTMPRLKAMTTGSAPNFLDILLNFDAASAALTHADHWLKQLKQRRNASLAFYGDDTWLKLFPGMFEHFEGTSSFFVSDYTEVDNNVTRHLDGLFAGRPLHHWDVLILHYLGVDHIGHLAGPTSDLMPVKLAEMDAVIEKIHQAISAQSSRRTLFIVCGDHGMNEAGNHGAASYLERATGIAFLHSIQQLLGPVSDNEELLIRRVQQIDIVPTISLLLGVPIPINNLGVLLPELFPKNMLDQAVSENSKQLETMLQFLQERSFAEEKTRFQEHRTHCNTMSGINDGSSCLLQRFKDGRTQNSTEQLFEVMKDTSAYLSGAFNQYKTDWMIYGLVAQFVGAAILLQEFFKVFQAQYLFVLLAYIGSNYSSSFVEEEHEFWFYMFATLGLLHFLFNKSSRIVIVCALHRLLYGWNSKGIKHAHLLNNIRKFMSMHFPPAQWLILLLSMGSIHFGLRHHKVAVFEKTLLATMCVLVFGYKLQTETAVHVLQQLSPSNFARLIFGIFLVYLLTGTRRQIQGQRFKGFSAAVTIMLVLLSRTYNTGILSIVYWMTRFLIKESTSIAPTALLILTHSSFFATGNTNSIATVDLANSFVGLDSQSMEWSGILTFISTFSAPICVWITMLDYGSEELVYQTWITFMVFRICSLVNISIVSTILRHHLFIWSVFSPKYLYDMVWLFGFGVLASCMYLMKYVSKPRTLKIKTHRE